MTNAITSYVGPLDRLGFRGAPGRRERGAKRTLVRVRRFERRDGVPQEARRLSVGVIGWVSEVRQIDLKEEGIDLKGHARRLKGKVPCPGKTDNYAEGSCCVMQWMLPPP